MIQDVHTEYSSHTHSPHGLSTRRWRACPAWGVAAMALCICGQTVLAGPVSKPVAAKHVTVQAFADRAGIVPGEPLTLAIHAKMEDGWHIYWKNPGGLTGLPTEIVWTVPAGFKTGDTVYPVPTSKYTKEIKETSFLLEDEAVFLTQVQVPVSAVPGEEVTFTAKVSWLVCKKVCVPGNVTVTLTLPVLAKGATAKPANEELFEDARDGLPTPAAKAKYLTISSSLDKKTVKPGDTFIASVIADIKPGHHMQSHKPFQDYLIPAVVFAAGSDGLTIGDVTYPKAHEREDKVLGKLSEYAGKTVFQIPVEVDEDASNAPGDILVYFQYQICNDTGTCYPPEDVRLTIPVQMAGGSAPEKINGEMPILTAADSTANAHGENAATSQEQVSQEKSILIRIQDWLFSLGFEGVLVAAFLGGFVLNLMPCVLPVISLKVLSFVRQAHEDRGRIFRMGLVYSAGIMVFFMFLATIFFVWNTGWGELFQDPKFVIIMSSVVLAFSLSLFGVFAVFTPKIVNELGQKAEAQEGYLSAFGTGVLATLLGTACTAPFLSAAIGYAANLPALQGASVFVAVGLGMASPFIALSYNPAWLRFVPKPGAWMGVFEAIMGFILLGTVVWLINPLRVQLGAYGLLLSLIFLLAVAIAVWIKGKIEFGAPLAKKVKLYTIAGIILLGGWLFPFRVMSTIPELIADQIEHHDLIARGLRDKYGKNLDWSKGIPWQPYVRELAIRDVQDGYTIFVDYTASWCMSCKSNLKVFIDQPEVIEVMRALDVVPYEADYSLRNPQIKKDLDLHGRAGVPMYLVYRPGEPESPEVLPEFLTKQTIIDALKRAGPSKIMPPQATTDEEK